MANIKDFLKNWGGFIALCIVALTFFSLFVWGEFKCESDILRIIIGLLTMPITTAASFLAFMEFRMIE